MLDGIRQGIIEVQNLPASDKGPLETWIYGMVIVNVVYYLVLGLVVVLLGKRLISATLAGLNESKRVAAQEVNGA